MPGGRMNVLVIMTDQQRADALGCGWPEWRGPKPALRTPHLDRLAAGGTRFARAYVANPLCMPLRATLLTGLPPRGHGVRTNGIDLDPRLPTLPGVLAAAGYRTHSVGKIHARVYDTPKGVARETLDPADYPEAMWMWEQEKTTHLPEPYYGFQTTEFTGGHGSWMWGDYVAWLERAKPGAFALLGKDAGVSPASGAEQAWKMAIPPELHYNTWVADRTIAFLEEAARGGKPFFASASFPDPHHPFATPDPWFSLYDRGAIPLPVRREGELHDLAPHFAEIHERKLQTAGRGGATKMSDDRVREIVAITYGMVSFVDEQAGRILDALDRLGLAATTAVCFMSDHGDMLGDHWLMNKGPFHFDGLLRVPLLWRVPGLPAGRVAAGLASHLDFVPTVCALTGAAAPEYGPPPGAAPEAEHQLRPIPGRSLVPLLDGSRERVQDAVVIENDEDYLGLRLRTLVTETHQLTIYVGEDGDEPYGELFDLAADPGQVRNLWLEPGAQALKSRLKDRLLSELVRTDSRLPRRHGHA